MSLGSTQFKNRAEAMDAFAAVEGLYVLGTTGIESIATMIPSGAAYNGSGTYTVTVVKGQNYLWTPAANDKSISNGATHGNVIDAGMIVAAETTLVLNGTPSASVTATLVLKAFWQKLWLYPAKALAAGVLTANSAVVNVGKSGSLAPQCVPDPLNPTDLPMIYQLPLGQKMALEQVILKGSVGDGVFYSFT